MRGGELVLHAFGWRHTMGECEATGARQRDTKHKVMRERDWEPPLLPPHYDVQLLLLPLALSPIGLEVWKCRKLP